MIDTIRPAGLLAVILFLLILPPVLHCETEVDPREGISAEIFGPKGGRFHPFVLLRETYTDNLYKTNSDTKDDFITSLSPGIWVAVPGTRVKPVTAAPDPDAPGGLQLSRMQPDTVRKFQAYALYSADFVNYSSHSDNDHTDHNVQALLQYNFSSGLSVDLLDMFSDREEVEHGMADTLYRRKDNLLNLILGYRAPSDNLKLKLDYKNYCLDYKDAAVDYRDRTDNSAAFSVSYRIRPKTFWFMGYGFSDIDFDAGSSNDSTENEFYSGVTWNMSGKTWGTLKVGYLEKDFDEPGVRDQDDISVELQGRYAFSPASFLQIDGYRKFNEADISGASSSLSTGVNLHLTKTFTPKWQARFSALYERSDYNEITRDDDLYSLKPAIRFTAKRWLIFDVEYTYENNDSNLQFYDYELHQFFLGASLVM